MNKQLYSTETVSAEVLKLTLKTPRNMDIKNTQWHSLIAAGERERRERRDAFLAWPVAHRGHIDLHVFASRAHYQVPTGNLQTPSVCNVLEVAIGAMHPNRFSNIKHQRPRVIPVPEHMKAQLSGLMRLVGDFGCWQL